MGVQTHEQKYLDRALIGYYHYYWRNLYMIKIILTRTTCWPTFLKKLRNIGQQICKNGLKWHVGAVCGASQHVGQHGIRMFFYDSNVKIVEFWMFFYRKWINIYTCWSDKKVFKANRTNMLVWFVGQHVFRFAPALSIAVLRSASEWNSLYIMDSRADTEYRIKKLYRSRFII